MAAKPEDKSTDIPDRLVDINQRKTYKRMRFFGKVSPDADLQMPGIRSVEGITHLPTRTHARTRIHTYPFPHPGFRSVFLADEHSLVVFVALSFKSRREKESLCVGILYEPVCVFMQLAACSVFFLARLLRIYIDKKRNCCNLVEPTISSLCYWHINIFLEGAPQIGAKVINM